MFPFSVGNDGALLCPAIHRQQTEAGNGRAVVARLARHDGDQIAQERDQRQALDRGRELGCLCLNRGRLVGQRERHLGARGSGQGDGYEGDESFFHGANPQKMKYRKAALLN